MTTIHFSTRNVEELVTDLLAMVGLFSGEDQALLHGFQLNIPWPDPKLLDQYRAFQTGTDSIILQVGSNAFAQVDNSPQELVKKLKAYKHVVNYILLDPSGGTGKLMAIGPMRDYLRAIFDAGLQLGVGIAGGLSAETLSMIEPIMAEFKGNISIDAEGRLRDEHDNLDLAKAKAYARRSLEMYKVYLS